MSRPQPLPLPLFSLEPFKGCQLAQGIIALPGNAHLLSRLPSGQLGLGIGHVPSKSDSINTLATLGQDGTSSDIVIEFPRVAKIQCSFEIRRDTNVVMFCDKSSDHTCQVLGENSTPFELDRPSLQVAVWTNLNTVIGIGGSRRRRASFQLVWHQDNPARMTELVAIGKSDFSNEYPDMAQTVDPIPATKLSRMETRVHAPPQKRMRHVKIGKLGSGQFGEVSMAINADSGELMAVKTLKSPTGAVLYNIQSVKREIEILSSIKHPHVVNYVASQGWEVEAPEIFMGLKEGSLNSLIERRGPLQITTDLAKTILHQMLQAIDCLADKGVIHRDVKPDNILYVMRPNGEFQFQLGDFGLANRAILASTFAGSPLYMAPEMLQSGVQTHKVDVWSLAVTILWALNVERFREFPTLSNPPDQVQKWICHLAQRVQSIPALQEMTKINPDERASAAQLLVEFYDRQGLANPRSRVPPLIRSANPHSGH